MFIKQAAAPPLRCEEFCAALKRGDTISKDLALLDRGSEDLTGDHPDESGEAALAPANMLHRRPD